MSDLLPLSVLLGITAVAIALSERGRRAAAVGYDQVPVDGYGGRAVVAIARTEAARLIRHPVVWLGLAGTVAATVSSWSDPALGSRWLMLGFLLYPLLGGLFIASHLAVARDRRAGTDELAAALPVSSARRTAGHLLTVAMLAVPIAAVWYVVVYARLGASWTAPLEGNGWNAVWEPGMAELAQPALMVVIVLSIAVAAGRWWWHPIAAVLIPLLLLISPFFWMVPLMVEGGHYGHWQTQVYVGEVTDAHVAWHLVFLFGMLTLAATGALLREDRRRPLLVIAALAVVGIVVGFALQSTVTPG